MIPHPETASKLVLCHTDGGSTRTERPFGGDLADREVISNAGRVTAEIARAHAKSEFERYRIVQGRLFESDFDRVVAETKRLAAKGKRPK